MKENLDNGFSLIELMVVIAIVALLASVAVPAYKTYMVKVKIYEGLSLLEGAKTKVIAFYEANNGVFPTATDIPNTNNPTTNIAVLSPVYGADNATGRMRMNVQFSASAGTELSGNYLFLEAKVSNGVWKWMCRTSTATGQISNIYLPAPCIQDLTVCVVNACIP